MTFCGSSAKQDAKRVIAGRRRFTCLSPGLVRMEFSPFDRFEDRYSIICHEKQKPVKFKSVVEKGSTAGDGGFPKPGRAGYRPGPLSALAPVLGLSSHVPVSFLKDIRKQEPLGLRGRDRAHCPGMAEISKQPRPLQDTATLHVNRNDQLVDPVPGQWSHWGQPPGYDPV